MKKVILDTSIIIDFLRRKDKERSMLMSLTEQKYHLAIALVTHTELFSGKSVWENTTIYDAVENICSGLQILPLDEKLSKKAGEIRAKTSTNDLFDCIIAATAIMHDLPLLTLNKKDFEHIAGLTLYHAPN